MNRFIIVGAGGHGKVIADNALKNGYTDIFFVDDNATGECMGFPIIGRCSELEALNDGNTDFIIGIGSNAIRKRIAEEHSINWVSLVHPSVQVAVNVSIGKGTVIMAGAVVNACAQIGEHCIINTCAVIEHDNVVGSFAHISPGAKLGGTVCVGDLTHIGIGATVSNNINICSSCIIGAGAVVVSDAVECGTYVGVPARRSE
ncbi:MAG: acetyltransferase [Ruminococcus sp.]|nr:acetyltransferase [Ruminococcus sp.]